MKKLISLSLCLLLAFALPLAVPARADEIWEPEDDFVWSHAEECVRVNADYLTLSDAVIRLSPENDAALGTIPAGELVRIYYTWENWGYTYTSYGEGWLDLTPLQRQYNASDFEAEHAGEIHGEFGTVSREENPSITVWTYPGSGMISSRILLEETSWADVDPPYQAVWTDGDGVRWGRMGYYYGWSGWICLDDPGAEAPEASPAEPSAVPSNAPSPAPSPDSQRNILLTICLIVAVIAATAAVAITLILRKKSTP